MTHRVRSNVVVSFLVFQSINMFNIVTEIPVYYLLTSIVQDARVIYSVAFEFSLCRNT